MRVLVCGGRDFKDEDAVYRALDAVYMKHGIEVVIHGAARGADTLGAKWAWMNDVAAESYPADWETHGKAAGPIRNQQMLTEGKPDAVVAFPGGRGTAHMVGLAKAAGIPVWEVGG